MRPFWSLQLIPKDSIGVHVYANLMCTFWPHRLGGFGDFGLVAWRMYRRSTSRLELCHLRRNLLL